MKNVKPVKPGFIILKKPVLTVQNTQIHVVPVKTPIKQVEIPEKTGFTCKKPGFTSY